MLIKINNQTITDSTLQYQEGMLFLLTAQNRKYYSNQNYITPHQLLDVNTKFIGITGTNGKTTTAFLIGYILDKLGYKVAVQGTEGFYLNNKQLEAKTLTTPPIITTIDRVYRYKPDFFVMEVSSHSIIQNRIEGINFSLKLFTNISQDHLDYHKSLKEYQRVKESFFMDDTLKIINKKYHIKIDAKNSYYYPLDKQYPTKLKGSFNQENFQLAILGVSKLLGIDIDKVAKLAYGFEGVRGRMEQVADRVIVDFAHTPDGMQKVLSSIKSPKIVVFGAGGDRDRLKRAKMGEVADRYSDYIILTNDNPRCEDEMSIIEDIKKGIKKTSYEIIPDRKDAIYKALSMQENRYIFVLGKGDERYIEKCDKKIPFNDKEFIKKIMLKL
jgi:UDP-N-acetylmuramoyl-L-alanyl-D-glutamate--2,6-diaminopimelate ligase